MSSHFDTPLLLGMGFLLALLAIPILFNTGILATLTENHSAITLGGMLLVWMVCVPLGILFFFKALHLLPFPQSMGTEGRRFIIVGIFNTVFYASIFNILTLFTGITRGAPILFFSLIAYGLSIIQAFWWNNYWIFGRARHSSTMRVWSLFSIVMVSTALVSAACTYVLITVLGAPAGISPRLWVNISIVLVIPLSFLGNFFGNKFFVFKQDAPYTS